MVNFLKDIFLKSKGQWRKEGSGRDRRGRKRKKGEKKRKELGEERESWRQWSKHAMMVVEKAGQVAQWLKGLRE